MDTHTHTHTYTWCHPRTHASTHDIGKESRKQLCTRHCAVFDTLTLCDREVPFCSSMTNTSLTTTSARWVALMDKEPSPKAHNIQQWMPPLHLAKHVSLSHLVAPRVPSPRIFRK
eukprot:6201338-Amphidinium_carterae.1